jgi:hypothetical protein
MSDRKMCLPFFCVTILRRKAGKMRKLTAQALLSLPLLPVWSE